MQDISEADQQKLYELLSGYRVNLRDLLDRLTEEFQDGFGVEADPLFLKVQLLAQHLGKVIATAPAELRQEILEEAREQEQLVIDHWDNAEAEENSNLETMPTKGEA